MKGDYSSLLFSLEQKRIEATEYGDFDAFAVKERTRHTAIVYKTQ